MERERSRVRLRKRTVVIIGAAVALASFLGALIIPLYSYPGTDWNTVVSEKLANPQVPMVVIVNPSTGPGTAPDQNYATGIQKLHNAGVIVIGYDDTAFASRPVSAVEADMIKYQQWYPGVTGIFLDDMSNVVGNEAYYSTLTSYAHSQGFTLVVGNPGASVPPSYIGTVDVIVTYENQGVPTGTSLASMTAGVPKNNFAVIAYGVSPASLNSSSVDSALNYANYIYVTNRTMPNPYKSLGSDFNGLVSILASVSNSAQTPARVPLTVQAQSLAGTAIAGLWTTITSSNGSLAASGFTPLTYSASSGVQYTVSVSNYGTFTFDHWAQGGALSQSTTVTPTKAQTLTAVYKTVVTESLVVDSVNPATGVSVTIASGGKVVASGQTPYTFVGVQGGSYTVTAPQTFGNSVLTHWDDGSTGTTRTVTLTKTTTIDATYGSTNSPVTIKSVDMTGKPITGLWSTVQSSNGAVVTSGFTPLTYTATLGQVYTICVSNYGNDVFSHWSDGTTKSCEPFTANGNPATLTAYFSTSSSITVNTVDQNGNTISGLWTVILNGGTTVTSGFTPLTYTAATSGQSYIVCASSYGNDVFSHWSDGNTNACETVTASGTTTLTADYSVS